MKKQFVLDNRWSNKTGFLFKSPGKRNELASYIHATKSPYLVYECYKNGILIRGADHIESEQLVYLASPTDDVQNLPARIKRAYNFEGAQKYRNGLGEIFVEAPAKDGALPKPYKGLKADTQKKLHINGAKKTDSTMLNLAGAVIMPRKWYGKEVAVSIYTTGVSRMEIRKAKAEDNYPTEKEIQKEFGANWQLFPYATCTYLTTVTERGIVRIPKFLREKADLLPGSPLTIYEKSGKAVIAPAESECIYDGEPIIPAIDDVQEQTLCESCEEETDLQAEIISLLKELIPAVKELQEAYEGLKDAQAKKHARDKELLERLREVLQ